MPSIDFDQESRDALFLLAHAEEAELDSLGRVRAALDAGYADPDFTQEEAAHLVGLTTRQLRYLLSDDKTSYRFEIDRRRMAKAEELLRSTNYLISAVGQLCG